ncbi:MAG: DUF432 domain-containing protein [Spirochaetales bacterium]
MSTTWGALKNMGDECIDRRIGDLTVYARMNSDEWELASAYDEQVRCVDDLAWSRYVTVQDDAIEIRPALPDRPVVVRPESPIVILPGRWGRFYFHVPIWARFLSTARGKTQLIEEMPTHKLQSTWFGDPVEGELCYSLESRLMREVASDHDDSNAVCEVTVQNQSKERLRFERICVHVESMRLFAGSGQLWTNELKVTFTGADQISDLTFRPDPPERAKHPVEVSEPRIAPDSNIFRRSFTLIREITGF